MKARSFRLAVEAVEDRSVPSTVAYGDFNRDGLVDVAAVTSPTTVTVSLANPDGSYTVSAILTAPKSQPIEGIYVGDYNRDGNLDVSPGGGLAHERFYTRMWQGDGDGTFGKLVTEKGGRIRPGW